MFRIWSINRRYPEPDVVTYTKGETLKIQDWKITLDNWEFYPQRDLEQLLEENDIIDFAPMAKKKLFSAQLTIKNVGENNNTLDVTNFAFESLAWHNQ